MFGLARPTGSTGGATIGNNVTLGGSASELRFNIEAGDPFTINGSIDETSTRGLHKVGAATLVLNGDATYTGSTRIRTGSFLLNGNLAGVGGVSVVGSGRLTGKGTVGGNLSVTGAASVVAPGESVGTLHIGGNASFGAAILEVDVSGKSNDLLKVASNSKLSFSGSSTFDAPGYVIASCGTLTGTFAPANVFNLPAGY